LQTSFSVLLIELELEKETIAHSTIRKMLKAYSIMMLF